MPKTSYAVELAKSSRSKCKKCKLPIQKSEMRICVSVEGGESGFDMTSYHHHTCFRLPRKFATGAGKISPEEFVLEYLEDKSDDLSLLPDRAEEIVSGIQGASLATATTRGGTKSTTKAKRSSSKNGEENVGDDDDDDEPTTLMGRLAKAYKNSQGGKRPNKKQKTNGDDADFGKMLEIYSDYRKTSVDGLKDILRWNRQYLTGKKDLLLFKVIDGEMYGRLACCQLCGGRLKFLEDSPETNEVACNGRFNEDLNIREPCVSTTTRDKAPRWKPWYTNEPTEEEKEEMDELIKNATEQVDGESGGADDAKVSKLLAKASDLDWDLSDRGGIKEATKELAELVKNGRVDVPADNIKMALGSMIVANKNKTPKEILQLVIDKYGFASNKAEKAKQQEAAAEGMCSNPKNAALFLAFQELAKLYFQEKNRNAGATYTKAANAIKGMTVEITAKNALSFAKGKTKVANIGKGSAEKMKEFMETGTMAKLEEKRANAA